VTLCYVGKQFKTYLKSNNYIIISLTTYDLR